MIEQRPLRKWPTATRKRALRMRRAGLTVTLISTSLHVPFTTVARWFRNKAKETAYSAEYRAKHHRLRLVYAGVVEYCPRCGNRGYAQLRYVVNNVTEHPSYFWTVQHNPGQKGENRKVVLCVVSLSDWDGQGIIFTSPARAETVRVILIGGE